MFGILKKFACGMFSYAPVILLWQFVPVDGSGANEQYVEAFRIFLFVATVHLIAATYMCCPFDRIAMATDIWLIVCGVLAWMQLWPQLNWFAGNLRGSGLWAVAVPLCLILTLYSKYGVIGINLSNPDRVRSYNLAIVALVVAVLIYSLFVRHSFALSVIVPTIGLSFLIHRARKRLS